MPMKKNKVQKDFRREAFITISKLCDKYDDKESNLTLEAIRNTLIALNSLIIYEREYILNDLCKKINNAVENENDFDVYEVVNYFKHLHKQIVKIDNNYIK